MDRLDDLLRRCADHPLPPAGFTAAVFRCVREDEERRGLRQFFSAALLVSASVLLSFHFISVAVMEFFGTPGRELLGGFYEEPGLLLSRDGWMALLEHCLQGDFLFSIVTFVFLLFALRAFVRVCVGIRSPSHLRSHVLR